MKKLTIGPLLAGALLLAACGGDGGEVGDDSEFMEFDVEDLVDIVRAGLTEESGITDLITVDVFTEADVAEFNEIALETCTELSDGMTVEEYASLRAEFTDGATELEDGVDVDAMTLALIDTSCPSYRVTLERAMRGY